jgi:cell division protease FtsH
MDNQNNNGGNQPQKQPNVPLLIALILGSILLAFVFYTAFFSGGQQERVKYTQFLEDLKEGKVKSVKIADNRLMSVTLKGDDKDATQTETQYPYYGKFLNQMKEISNTYETMLAEDMDTLMGRLEELGVEGELVSSGNGNYILELLLTVVLPVALVWILLSFLFRKMSGGAGPMGMGKSNAKVYVQKETGVTFKDVAGEDEAKESLVEVVDFLHNPQKYSKIGAKLPKGALLVGPPGTGKTLLARAVAGEAHVPFFSLTGSDFVELYVGMGASRVRDLFKEANKNAPCIIFIDEIDAIGKKRGGGGFGGNDEREQTLNQLLTEMDGFDGTKGIIVLAATNQPDSLDPALLRPGRFDRRVPVELPDMQGRVDILKVHAAKVKMAGNINYEAIAKACPGASGAELANMINEAALRAVKAGRERVNQQDLEESIEVVMAGYKKKNQVLTSKEKLIVAYHEVGHALVAAKQDNSAPVHKITIIPRTSGALGYTMQVDDNGNHYLMSKEELTNKIATLTGGRAAEALIFKSITTGASNDIEQATKLARGMIAQYGMSDQFGMVALQTKNNAYLGGDMSIACSEDTMKQVDDEVIALVKAQYEKAYQILESNIMKLHEIVKYLYERETITGEEFMQILNAKENAIEEQAKANAEALAEAEHRQQESDQAD